MKKKWLFITVFGGVVFTGIWGIKPVHAQAVQPPAPLEFSKATQSTALEEIVVTAQRRSENLQNVGIAVAAVSGDELKARGVTSSTDIVRFMPGINSVGTVGDQGQQFSIRGVTENAYSEAIEPPIAVYIDDVYVASQQGQGMALFDMARVEALKGPQGTLFGRNATGGLIQFVVNKPSLSASSGYLDATYGNFNQTILEGALNTPVSDQVAIRASGFWSHHDPVWKNIYPQGMAPGAPLTFGGPGPSPSGQGQDLGGEETVAGRLQMLWAPTSSLEMRLTGSVLRQRMSTSPWTEEAVVPEVDAKGHEIGEIVASPTETRAAIGPDGQNFFNPKLVPFEGFLFSPHNDGHRAPGADWSGYTPVSADDLKLSVGFARSNLNTFNAYNNALHIDDDLGGVRFASVTAWSLYEKNFILSDGAPVTRVGYGAKARTETISEEARFSGGVSNISWTAGAYYLHLNSKNAEGLLPPSGSALAAVFNMAATGVQPLSVYTLRTDSGSLFGQVDWTFLPDLKLVIGGRGIYERQHYDYASYAFASPNNYVIDTSHALFPLLPGYENSRSELLWAGKAQLEYRPWTGLLIYGGVNRGVKAGGYNGQLFTGDPPISPSQIPFKPEALTSLEGGFKLAEPGGRYTLDAAVFHYFYHNYQSDVFTNVNGIVQNNDAETTGAELEANVKIIDNLTLKLAGAYVDAIVKNLQIAPGVFSNTRPTFTPKYSGSVALAYRVPQEVLSGSLSLDASVFSESSFYHNAKNFAGDLFAGHTLVDLNANWTGRSGFSVSAYVKNVADQRYKTAGLDLSAACGCNVVAYGTPRTFGVTLRQSF